MNPHAPQKQRHKYDALIQQKKKNNIMQAVAGYAG